MIYHCLTCPGNPEAYDRHARTLRVMTETMMELLHGAQRIVIKTGSALVADGTGVPRRGWMETLAADMRALQAAGKQVMLVSSGAVALGRGVLGLGTGALKLEEKQAAAACGQIALMEAWQACFAAHGLKAAQLLLTLDVSEDRRRYLNARGTVETLLEHGVVPVFNENDTVATAELRVGDNDRLAARVAQMAGADVLVLLSDVDGLYTADPSRDAAAEHIGVVEVIDAAVREMAGGAKSAVSSGGMQTKIEAAEIATGNGCHTIITLGTQAHPLRALQEGARRTWFLARTTPHGARKAWIAGTLKPKGEVSVDAGAEKALLAGNSLLPVGVKEISGHFERGDAVLIRAAGGRMLAKGLSAYSCEDARKIMGKNSRQTEAILGYKGRDALVHRDDMVLL